MGEGPPWWLGEVILWKELPFPGHYGDDSWHEDAAAGTAPCYWSVPLSFIFQCHSALKCVCYNISRPWCFLSLTIKLLQSSRIPFSNSCVTQNQYGSLAESQYFGSGRRQMIKILQIQIFFFVEWSLKFETVSLSPRFCTDPWGQWYPRCESELWELGHREGSPGGGHVSKPCHHQPWDYPVFQLQGEEGPLSSYVCSEPVPVEGGEKKKEFHWCVILFFPFSLNSGLTIYLLNSVW